MRCPNREFWVVLPENKEQGKEEIKMRVRFADLGDAVSTLNFKMRRLNGNGNLMKVRACIEVPRNEFSRPELKGYRDDVTVQVNVSRAEPIEGRLPTATHALANLLTEKLGKEVRVEIRRPFEAPTEKLSPKMRQIKAAYKNLG